MRRIIDPSARARSFTAIRGGMRDQKKLDRRLQKVEQRVAPVREDALAPQEWSVIEEVEETPDADEDAVGRVFLRRNDDADDVLSAGITGADGTPILVDLSTVPSNSIELVMASEITGLSGITGVTLDPSGNIYISSYDAGTLQRYTPSLALTWTVFTVSSHQATDGVSLFSIIPASSLLAKRIASTGAAGSPSTVGTLISPVGVAQDGTNVYVSDEGAHAIKRYSISTGVINGTSAGWSPSVLSGLAVSGGVLYILSPNYGQIITINASTFAAIATFTVGLGTGEGQIGSTAEGIAIDALGRIWIADTPNHRINVYDSSGVFLASIGSFGAGDGRFKFPKQINFNAAGTIAYVADSGNNRLVSLQVDTGLITPVITERTGTPYAVGAGNNGSGTATCAAGEVSIGGGSSSNVGNSSIYISVRSGFTGWTTNTRNLSNGGMTVTPSVICLKVPF